MRTRHKPLLLTVAVLAMLLAIAAPVGASSRSPVEIEVLTDINASVNDFDAESQILCDMGTVENTAPFVFATGLGNPHMQIVLGKHFVCEDRSGTFDILIRVRLSFVDQTTEGTWSVVRGTGAYEKLHGNGTVLGIPQGNETILDIYTGTLHVD